MTTHLPIADQAAMRAAPTVVRQLHTIRLRHGISAETLSHRLGAAKNTVWRWETGRHIPSVDAAVRWAAELGYELVLRPSAGPS